MINNYTPLSEEYVDSILEHLDFDDILDSEYGETSTCNIRYRDMELYLEICGWKDNVSISICVSKYKDIEFQETELDGVFDEIIEFPIKDSDLDKELSDVIRNLYKKVSKPFKRAEKDLNDLLDEQEDVDRVVYYYVMQQISNNELNI